MQESIVAYPAPERIQASADYRVRVDGQPVFVYIARVSAMPHNQVWPGYQRPLDQTELAAFAYWDMPARPITVEVTSLRPVESVVVRPQSYGIQPVVHGNTITFTLDGPRQVVVEVNGMHHALHLFANPLEEDAPEADAEGVRYYGPGVHEAGTIELHDNETLYIAGGAVVYGGITARNATNITIRGRGILDNSRVARSEAPSCVVLYGCSDVEIEGLIFRDPNVWAVTPTACQRVHMANLKLIGLWRYNADGIDIVNCQDVRIEDCFVRSFDDSIVIKGLKSRVGPSDHLPVRDVYVDNCVLWNDWGRALEIGAETCAPEMANLVFENCDVIHADHVALDIQHGDRAHIHNVVFRDIRVEMDDGAPRPVYQQERGEKFVADTTYCPRLFVAEIHHTMWSKDEQVGDILDVLLEDVTAFGCEPESVLEGYDAEHQVRGVTFRNVRINGRLVTDLASGNIQANEFVDDVRFVAG